MPGPTVTCMYAMEPRCEFIKFNLRAYKSLTKLCLYMFLLGSSTAEKASIINLQKNITQLLFTIDLWW